MPSCRARHGRMMSEERNDLEEARADADRAIELEPRQFMGRLVRGTVASIEGRLDDAIVDWTEAVSGRPWPWPTWPFQWDWYKRPGTLAHASKHPRFGDLAGPEGQIVTTSGTDSSGDGICDVVHALDGTQRSLAPAPLESVATEAGIPMGHPPLSVFRADVRLARTPADANGLSRSPCLRHRGRDRRRRRLQPSPECP